MPTVIIHCSQCGAGYFGEIDSEYADHTYYCKYCGDKTKVHLERKEDLVVIDGQVFKIKAEKEK